MAGIEKQAGLGMESMFLIPINLYTPMSSRGLQALMALSLNDLNFPPVPSTLSKLPFLLPASHSLSDIRMTLFFSCLPAFILPLKDSFLWEALTGLLLAWRSALLWVPVAPAGPGLKVPFPLTQ